MVSRALILHNMLITALREVGFFNAHTIWADEKPGVFLPYHLLKMGERQKYYNFTLSLNHANPAKSRSNSFQSRRVSQHRPWKRTNPRS